MGAYFVDRGLVWTLAGHKAPDAADVKEHVGKRAKLAGIQIEIGARARLHPEIVRVLRAQIFTARPRIPFRVYLAEKLDLSFLELLPMLEDVTLEASRGFTNVAALASLPRLRRAAFELPKHVDGDVLAHLPAGLRSLTMRPDDRASPGVIDLSPLARLRGLKELHLESYGAGLPAVLPSLRKLQRLGLRSIKSLTDLVSVASLTELRLLSLFGGGFSSLAPLTTLSHLRGLHLWNVPKLASLEPIIKLTALEVLIAEALNLVAVFPDAKRMARLRAVKLVAMKKLRDFRGLARAPALEEFVIQRAEAQRPDDFIPVLRSRTLKRAGFGFQKKDDVRRMSALCAKHEKDGQVYLYPQLRGRYGALSSG
jgi:hypothetical protein